MRVEGDYGIFWDDCGLLLVCGLVFVFKYYLFWLGLFGVVDYEGFNGNLFYELRWFFMSV